MLYKVLNVFVKQKVIFIFIKMSMSIARWKASTLPGLETGRRPLILHVGLLNICLQFSCGPANFICILHLVQLEGRRNINSTGPGPINLGG